MGGFRSTFLLFVIRFDFHEVGPGRLALAKPGYATLGAVLGWDEAWLGLPWDRLR